MATVILGFWVFRALQGRQDESGIQRRVRGLESHVRRDALSGPVTSGW